MSRIEPGREPRSLQARQERAVMRSQDEINKLLAEADESLGFVKI